ncbi:MAG: hypothetical protein ABH821_02340 [archaeon]
MTEKKLYYVMIVLIVLALLPVWVFKTPVMLDYSNLLVRAHIVNNYDSVIHYQEDFNLNLLPTPNVLTDSIVIILNQIMPLTMAGKILLSIVIILFPLSILYFLKKVNPEKQWLALFAFLLTYNHFLALGLVNYLLAFLLGFIILGYYWSHRKKLEPKNMATLAVLNLAMFFSHLFAFGIFFLALMFLSFVEKKNLKQSLKAFLTFIPSFLLLGFFWVSANAKSPITFYDNFLLEKAKNIATSFISYNILIEGLILIVPAIIFLYLLLRTLKQGKSLLKNPFFLLSIFLFLLFLITPAQFGVIRPDKRIVLPLFFVSLAFISVKINEKLKKVFQLTLIFFTVLMLVNTMLVFSEYNKRADDYIEVLNAIPENQLLFVKSFDGLNERINIYSSLWGYYAIEKNGRRPTMFASEFQIIGFKNDVGHFIGPPDNELTEFGCDYYDFVVVGGFNEEYLNKINPCYEIVLEKDNIFLLKNKRLIE